MKHKITVGIIFGGRSAEHEVSLRSARNVIAALDRKKYDPILIGVSKMGEWYVGNEKNFFISPEDPKKIKLNIKDAYKISITPGSKKQLHIFGKKNGSIAVDVVFPILHGSNGEDGSMQGLLQLMDVPYVGPDVMSSAVGMDKDVAKRLWQQAGMLVADFVTIKKSETESINFSKIKNSLHLPMFVKPARLGSSVGISKVKNEKEFWSAVNLAFKYDDKILIEKYIKGREIEVAVLGNEKPLASIAGEIVPHYEFYNYEAKYVDANGSTAHIPAQLKKNEVIKVQKLATEAYQVLGCEGLSRVDFFLTVDGGLYINEINTIPGFTSSSMYPKLWEVSGISYPILIDNLLQLAISRHDRLKKLETTYEDETN